jgi:two-component system, sensor histidine kinase and response regulator
VVRMMAVRAQEKGLELLYDNRCELPGVVLGDPGRLRQVVVNLLGNAIKFTESGEVSLTVDEAREMEDSLIVRFAVTDTGIGISREWQDRIFAAFVQADGSHTRRYGGTGLGLSISSRLVAFMGGRLSVHSEEGRGSAFQFTVEFGLPPAARGKARIREPEALRGRDVLVVDDNATNRRILRETLLGWHARPFLADSGESALEMLRRHAGEGNRFALALVDAHMPGMDGFTLARQLQMDRARAGHTLMMVRAMDLKSVDPELRADGRYVTKPVTRSNLLKTISKVLEEGSQPLVTSHFVRAAAAGPALRVLLAEDNAVNQKVMDGLLRKQGHSVELAANGAEAVAAVTRQTFDLVFMDVQMPEMSGYEATRAIRERERETGRHVPIIALTAHAMKGDREICLDAGMDDYLGKPVHREELVAMLERWRNQGPDSTHELAARPVPEGTCTLKAEAS